MILILLQHTLKTALVIILLKTASFKEQLCRKRRKYSTYNQLFYVLFCKLNDIRGTLTLNFKIICVTFQLPNYSIIHQNRSSSKKGGGDVSGGGVGGGGVSGGGVILFTPPKISDLRTESLYVERRTYK